MKFTLRATFDAAPIERDGRHYLILERSELHSLFDSVDIVSGEYDPEERAASPIPEFVEECFNLLREHPKGLAPWEIERLLRENTTWGFTYQDIEASLESLLRMRRVTFSGFALWRANDKIASQGPDQSSAPSEGLHEAHETVGEPVSNLDGSE